MTDRTVPTDPPADWPPSVADSWRWAVSRVGAPAIPPPNLDGYNPDPEYLRGLMAAAGLSVRGAAAALGVSEATMGRYVRRRRWAAGASLAPYPVQYALEALAIAAQRAD